MDPDVRTGDGRLVTQLVADDVDAKAEFIDQRVCEDVAFRDAPKAAVQRNMQGKIQVVDTRLATCLDTVPIGPKGFESVGIGPEKALRQVIFASTKLAIPIRCELIVTELPRIGKNERSIIGRVVGKPRSSLYRGKQKPSWPKLSARYIRYIQQS
jgi:hypothetical protein